MWRCPNCETLNDGEFCVVCGEKYEENKYIQEMENIIGENSNAKNICSACGAGNSDDASYCWKCGNTLEKGQNTWVKSVAIILLGIVILMLLCNGLGVCSGAEEYEEEAVEVPYNYAYSEDGEIEAVEEAEEEATEEAAEYDFSYTY